METKQPTAPLTQEREKVASFDAYDDSQIVEKSVLSKYKDLQGAAEPRIYVCPRFNKKVDIQACLASSQEFEYDIGEVLGKGAFGTVYRGSLIKDGRGDVIPIAMKIVKLTDDSGSVDDDKVALFTNEWKMSHIMSKREIGPDIYDVCTVKIKGTVAFGVLVMELFEGDMLTFYGLNRGQPSPLKFRAHEDQLTAELTVELIRKLVNEGFYCVDLKAGNVVYRKEGKTLKLRLIDFDINYCNDPTPIIEWINAKITYRKLNIDPLDVLTHVLCLIYRLNIYGYSKVDVMPLLSCRSPKAYLLAKDFILEGREASIHYVEILYFYVFGINLKMVTSQYESKLGELKQIIENMDLEACLSLFS